MFNTYIKGVDRTDMVRMIETLDSGEKVVHFGDGSLAMYDAKDVEVVLRVFESNNKESGE